MLHMLTPKACLSIAVFLAVLTVTVCVAEGVLTHPLHEPSIFHQPIHSHLDFASHPRRAAIDLVSYGCFNCLRNLDGTIKTLRVSKFPLILCTPEQGTNIPRFIPANAITYLKECRIFFLEIFGMIVFL